MRDKVHFDFPTCFVGVPTFEGALVIQPDLGVSLEDWEVQLLKKIPLELHDP